MDLLITALLAMGSVSLWTLRLAVTTRGLRLVAVPLAAIEAIVYVTAFGQVLADLEALDRRLAFGIGVAAGTYLAMCVADRISGEPSSSEPSAGRTPAATTPRRLRHRPQTANPPDGRNPDRGGTHP